MSVGASEAFYEASLDAGVAADPDVIARSEAALGDPHYGRIMEDNLAAATVLLEEGSEDLSIEEIPAAMASLAVLLSAAGEDYRQSGHAPQATGADWQGHMANVRSGKIEMIVPDFWTTADGGRRQAQHADTVLSSASPGVEPVLAALNYGLYFKPGTMAGASRILAKSPEEAAGAEGVDGMPHLDVTNWTIGETVQHFYEMLAAGRSGQLHVVDMCSGTGATLTAITQRLKVAQDGGYGLDQGRLSLTGFETTPAFYEQLTGDYMSAAGSGLAGLGINSIGKARLDGFHNQVRPGEMNLVQGDVVEGIKDLDLSELSSKDLLVATANYGFHRLPSSRKAEIIDKLSEAENSVIVIGDLRQNGSAVNRGYFNLSNNGPLNPGNIGLEDELDRHGYVTYTIGRTVYPPRFIDEVLRERLSTQLEDDGFVTIAVKGRRAHELMLAA